MGGSAYWPPSIVMPRLSPRDEHGVTTYRHEEARTARSRLPRAAKAQPKQFHQELRRPSLEQSGRHNKTRRLRRRHHPKPEMLQPADNMPQAFNIQGLGDEKRGAAVACDEQRIGIGAAAHTDQLRARLAAFQ